MIKSGKIRSGKIRVEKCPLHLKVKMPLVNQIMIILVEWGTRSLSIVGEGVNTW